jgi:hypothetical protein
MPKSKTMNDEGKEEEEGDHAEDVLKEIREDNIRAARKQRSKYNKTAATTTKSTNSNQRWPAK